MSEKKVMKIKVLGGISFWREGDETWHTVEELSLKGVGKKQVAFLTYFLLNHRRKISSEELIQKFWPEESKNPANVLKNMMHKTRTLLKEMFPDCREVLVTYPGGYGWNSELSLELDVEVLERIYRKMKQADEKERIHLGMEAFEIYRGDILSGISLDWLDHMNTYFRNLYIDLCKMLAVNLQEEERWDEAILVCRQAYSFAPEVEEFTVCFMHALIVSGQTDLAIRHYETYRTMLWKEYSLVPSEAVEQIYHLAVQYSGNSEDYAQELIAQITQMPESPKAFQCSLLVFRNVIHLEQRNMLRNGHSSSIVVLHAGKQDPNQPPSTDIRRMERTLLYSLRAGDPFARLNTGSFILLLPGASVDNAKKVMERVERDFYGTYPKSKANLKHRIYPLTVEKE